MTGRRWSWGAVALAVAAAVCTTTAAVLLVVDAGAYDDRLDSAVWLVLLVPSAAVAVLLAARLPRHPLTWALVVYVGCQLAGAAVIPLLRIWLGEDAGLVHRVDDLLWLGTLPVLALLITLFPEGRGLGRVRGTVARLQVGALAGLAVIALVRGSHPPEGLVVVTGVLAGVLVLSGVVGAGALAVRAIRQRATRQELGPFAFVVVLAVVCWLALPSLTRLVALPDGTGAGLPFLVVIGLPPLGLGYAVLRHHLFGLDVVVRRVAVASLVSASLVAVYLGCAAAVAAATGVPRESLAAALLPAGIVSVALLPAYRSALRVADRGLYGDRRDPLALLSSLGAELGSTTPDEVPSRVVSAVASSLRLPWVALDVDREGGWERVAETGVQSAALGSVAFPLLHAGERPGRLLVQPRRGEPRLGRLDERVLGQLAVQLGPAAAAMRLVDELTLSRERLVEGREAERARLRRELHDGLSPSLAGMSLAVQAAERRLEDDPEAARRLLASIAEESTAAWRVVRSILDDLRPPGLDELGLVGSVEQRAQQLSRPGEFTVEVVGQALPVLPPALELAAYRITSEAMANAARHSGGRRCCVTLRAGSSLECRVVDDGCGLDPRHSSGHGLGTMAERAAELGGRLVVEPTPGGGTTVVAELPLVVP